MGVANAIVDAVERHGKPMSTAEIVEEVSEYAESSVRGELTPLVRQGELHRLRQGWYEPGDGQTANGTRVADTQKPAPAEAEAGEVAQQGPRDAIYNVTASALSRRGREVFWIFVRGDSMGKVIQKHTMVPVVRFDPTRKEITVDDVYFFRLEGAVQIKRLQRLKGQRIKVISDNARYDSQIIELDSSVDFEILGRVLL
ncbi:MAG: hypothetical protein BRD37_03430 [Bacteroidetes bacterium QH_8_67_23]|nr:MAG: hypothetical protein BRD37_03430 [Bacteroidetes bacterium QH_8_67_23]